MKVAMCHSASTLVLAFLYIGRAAALTTLGGLGHTDGVVNAAMFALTRHDKPTTDDLEQVAGHLAQLASAKISDEQMGVNVKDIAKTISDLVSALQTDARNAAIAKQAVLDGLYSKIGQCKKPSDFQDHIKDLEGYQTSNSTTWITCQSNLQTLTGNHQQCTNLVATLTSSRDSACDVVGQGAGAPSPDSGVCSHSSSETYKDWVTRLAGYFDTKKTEYVEKETKCVNLRDYVLTNTTECNNRNTDVNNKQQECNTARTALNTAGCALANTQATVCHEYNCCYRETTQAYTLARTTAEPEGAAFAAQFAAMAKILCLVRVVTSGETITTDKVASCMKSDSSSTQGSSTQGSSTVTIQPVELKFYDLPVKLSCTLPTVYPCEAAWEQQHQIGATCIPCQGITDSTTCGTGGGNSGGAGGGGAGSSGGAGGGPAPEVKTFLAGSATYKAWRCTMDATSQNGVNCQRLAAHGVKLGGSWNVALTQTGEILIFGLGVGEMWSCPNDGGSASNPCTKVMDSALRNSIYYSGGGDVYLGSFKLLPNGDFMLTQQATDKQTVFRCSFQTTSCAAVAGHSGKRGSGLDQFHTPHDVELFDNGDYAITDPSNKRILRCPADGSGNCEIAFDNEDARRIAKAPNGDFMVFSWSKAKRCPQPASGATGTCQEIGDLPNSVIGGPTSIAVSPKGEPWGTGSHPPSKAIFRCIGGTCTHDLTTPENPANIAFEP